LERNKATLPEPEAIKSTCDHSQRTRRQAGSWTNQGNKSVGGKRAEGGYLLCQKKGGKTRTSEKDSVKRVGHGGHDMGRMTWRKKCRKRGAEGRKREKDRTQH